MLSSLPEPFKSKLSVNFGGHLIHNVNHLICMLTSSPKLEHFIDSKQSGILRVYVSTSTSRRTRDQEPWNCGTSLNHSRNQPCFRCPWNHRAKSEIITGSTVIRAAKRPFLALEVALLQIPLGKVGPSGPKTNSLVHFLSIFSIAIIHLSISGCKIQSFKLYAELGPDSNHRTCCVRLESTQVQGTSSWQSNTVGPSLRLNGLAQASHLIIPLPFL